MNSLHFGLADRKILDGELGRPSDVRRDIAMARGVIWCVADIMLDGKSCRDSSGTSRAAWGVQILNVNLQWDGIKT
jgi:hypothetical protein